MQGQDIFLNEFYRQKARVLLMQLKEAHNMITRHNLSRGIIGEEILRNFLSSILPQNIKVSQGFVENHEKVSRQCDIIIYDRNYPKPIYSFGQTEIVPAQAVKAVIEVKTNISASRFGKVLKDFKELGAIGVANKYLFLYSSPTTKSLKKYFFLTNPNNETKERACVQYDHGDERLLPNAIIGLDKNIYFQQDYVQDQNNDCFGYAAYQIKDGYGGDSYVSVLQWFIRSIFDDIKSNPMNEVTNLYHTKLSDEDINKDEMQDFKLSDAIALYSL